MWQAGVTPGNPGNVSSNPIGRSYLLGNLSGAAETQTLGWVTGVGEVGRECDQAGKVGKAPRHGTDIPILLLVLRR